MNYSTSPTSSTGSYFSESIGATSRSLNQDALIYKLRYDAGRGFDPDDDFEFCPALTERTPRNSFEFVSPVRKYQPSYTNPIAHPRAHKALDIINPVTGLRVSSPKLKH